MPRDGIVSEIAAVISEVRLSYPVRVAIDGRDGAGKTSLADELVEPLRFHGREVIRASIDGFHNPKAMRYARGRCSPEGYFVDSFNYDMLRRLLLDPLGPDGSREYRTSAFDWRTDSSAMSPLRRSSDDALLVFDGVFLLRPELVDYWEFTVFVDVTVEVGTARCALRAGSSSNPDTDLNKRYIEGQRLYISQCNPKRKAHVVIDNNDVSAPTTFWNVR